MATVKLPTYKSKLIDQPARTLRKDPSAEIVAANAQNRFMGNLFGAAADIMTQAVQRHRADLMGRMSLKYNAWKTDKLREIEQKPIGPRDPRFQEIPEEERALPNLSSFTKQRSEFLEGLNDEIDDRVVRDAFKKWADERWIGEQDSLARWDFAKTKEIRFDDYGEDFLAAIESGDVGICKDLSTAALADGTIDQVQFDDHMDLAHKDVTKQGAFVKALGMGEGGLEWLTNRDNLKYATYDGQIKEMPLGDQVDLIKRFKDTWKINQDEQKKAWDLTFITLMGAIDSGKLDGKSIKLNELLGVIEDPATNLDNEMHGRRTVLREMIDNRIHGPRSTEIKSDPFTLMRLSDARNDPTIPDSQFRDEVARAARDKKLSTTDTEQWYNKDRPETPMSRMVSKTFGEAVQGAYPLMAPEEAGRLVTSFEKEIEQARKDKKPYSDEEIQKRLEAIMYPYKMQKIGRLIDKSVTGANEPTESDKKEYEVFKQAMSDKYDAVMGRKNFLGLGTGGWEPNLENIEAMQSYIDQGKTFGMWGNPLFQPHFTALRIEYGKLFKKWSGKDSELKSEDGTPGMSLKDAQDGGRAVYGLTGKDGRKYNYTVKINPKTNDEEWFLINPKNREMMKVDKPL